MNIKDILQRSENIPFGNSAYQINKFTEHLTPERQQRHALINFTEKVNILKKTEFSRERIKLDIEEIKDKILKSEGIEKKRLEIDLKEKEWDLSRQIKLINDCFIECSIYAKIIENTPVIDRQKFEDAEQNYWTNRLLEDAKREVSSYGSIKSDTLKSINDIGYDISVKEGKLLINTYKSLEVKHDG